MLLGILSAGIENEGYWLWPSRSFGHFEFRKTASRYIIEAKTLSFWRCFSSLAAALEVVRMTTSSATSDENFIRMMTFSFQCGGCVGLHKVEWRVQNIGMMTSSDGKIFRVIGLLWGEFTGGFPSQRPLTRSFDVFFDLRPNKRLSKPSRRCFLSAIALIMTSP